jgi:nucleoside-diphosphate-sugar epimerase
MCSRGSVIPLWIDQIRKGNPITLTEPKMTRFIMSLEEAVDLVLFAFENGKNGDILVQKAPACTIQTQAEAVCELFKHQYRRDVITNTDCTDNTDEGDGQIYDLQGRKVQQPVRGIYVQNGKKIVVK